ncbi:hypothetical protein [Paenibacillus sp. IHBB 10380]|uniref:hypothetical protein n=1 Tax=Paenibacillus sp. IHBB 10380 TaxID=1566358 RepID=UPI001185140C|nr:hypothetical protein [Paenibacillus sp. IHBB 10380]
MKIITKENYYLPCEQVKALGKLNTASGMIEALTEQTYIDSVKDISLNTSVPDEVKSLFEVSLALHVYGFLCWAFFTIANEQSYKAFECAISYKHNEIMGTNYDKKGTRQLNLNTKIRNLIEQGILKSDQELQYKALRELRNSAFHPSSQSNFGHDQRVLRLVAKVINELFDH